MYWGLDIHDELSIEELSKQLFSKPVSFVLEKNESDHQLTLSGTVPAGIYHGAVLCIPQGSPDLVMEVDKEELLPRVVIKDGESVITENSMEAAFHGVGDIKDATISLPNEGVFKMNIAEMKTGAYLHQILYPELFSVSKAGSQIGFVERDVECNATISAEGTSSLVTFNVDIKVRAGDAMTIAFKEFTPLVENASVDIECPTIEVKSFHPMDRIVEIVTRNEEQTNSFLLVVPAASSAMFIPVISVTVILLASLCALII